MGYYIKFQRSSGGTFNWPIFSVNGNSVTIPAYQTYRYNNTSASQFFAAVMAASGLNLAEAGFILNLDSVERITGTTTRQRLSDFNFVLSEDFIGETWTSGNIKIVWSRRSATEYMAQFYGENNRALGPFYCQEYNTSTGYLACPFAYSLSEQKLIWLGTPSNLIALSSDYYVFNTENAVRIRRTTDADSVAINSGEVKPTSTDPYQEIPENEPGGGTGSYDFSGGDTILVPQLPQISAKSTGFVALWAPTDEQLLDLSAYMWNADPTTIQFWKKLIADPIDLIYGLNIIPLNLRSETYDIVDDPAEFCVGMTNTHIEMDTLKRQWVELDCGSIEIPEKWGAYLDYDPYTKMEIYLPYCGTHPLRVDDFMNGTISLKYHIDLLSGACVAMISSTRTDDLGELNAVMYQFMGNCATQIPVSGSQYSDAVRAVVTIAAAIGTMVALGGAGGAAGAAAEGEAAMPAATGGTAAETSSNFGGYLTAGAGAGAAAGTAAATQTSQSVSTLYQVGQMRAASAAVSNVMGMKPQIERSGAIGAAGGLLAVQKPYIIITHPNHARPGDQNVYTGYPAFMTRTLEDLEGFTQVQAIHLEGIPCTATELAEIDALLKSGVIF